MTAKLRSAATNIKAIDVARMLGRAGYEWRRDGHHITATKPGATTIRFGEPLDMNQWRAVESAVGVAMESLLTKQKRGQPGDESEWRKRLLLTRDLFNMGMRADLAAKHGGTFQLYSNGFRPNMVDALGLDECLKYRHARAVELTAAPTVTPVETPAAPTHVAVASKSDDVGALLSMMSEIQTDIRVLSVSAHLAKQSQSVYDGLTALRTHLRESASIIESLLKSLEPKVPVS